VGGAPIDGKDKNKACIWCKTYKSHSVGVKRFMCTCAYKELECLTTA
jgi:hypothetical protein